MPPTTVTQDMDQALIPTSLRTDSSLIIHDNPIADFNNENSPIVGETSNSDRKTVSQLVIPQLATVNKPNDSNAQDLITTYQAQPKGFNSFSDPVPYLPHAGF